MHGLSAFDDHVRCLAATTLLEPIAEGLSLFAEFDTYPGRSPWMSQTLTASSLYFSPAVDTDNRPEILIQGMLQSLRRDPRLLERKSGVYAQTGFSPYLIGYLSVKSLWSRMAAACEEFNDRDLFLSYLRSYIYDDPGMVSVLLKPEKSEVHAVSNIANHLLNRIRKLVSFHNLSENIDQWIRSAQSGCIDISTIGYNKYALEESNRLLERALIEEVHDIGNEEISAWLYMTLEERSVCVLGSVEVVIQTTNSGQVNILSKETNDVIYTFDESESSFDGHEVGELFIIGTSDAHALISIMRLNNKKAILLSSLGSYSDYDLSLSKRLVMNRPISRTILNGIREKLQQDNVSGYIWQIIQKQMEPALRAVYGPLCTLNADINVWEKTFEKILDSGLHGLLGKDSEVTRAIAGIGLLNCFTTEIDTIKTLIKPLDIEENSFNRVLKFNRKFGLRVIAKSKNSVLSLV